MFSNEIILILIAKGNLFDASLEVLRSAMCFR